MLNTRFHSILLLIFSQDFTILVGNRLLILSNLSDLVNNNYVKQQMFCGTQCF